MLIFTILPGKGNPRPNNRQLLPAVQRVRVLSPAIKPGWKEPQ
ncbi:MAG: hypothetical protein Q7U20_07785 [Caulobacter sp.]|nr:hypothetical protein [Caulobacter sp.]